MSITQSVSHGTCRTLPNVTEWYLKISNGTRWYQMVLHDTRWYQMVTNGILKDEYKWGETLVGLVRPSLLVVFLHPTPSKRKHFLISYDLISFPTPQPACSNISSSHEIYFTTLLSKPQPNLNLTSTQRLGFT